MTCLKLSGKLVAEVEDRYHLRGAPKSCVPSVEGKNTQACEALSSQKVVGKFKLHLD